MISYLYENGFSNQAVKMPVWKKLHFICFCYAIPTINFTEDAPHENFELDSTDFAHNIFRYMIVHLSRTARDKISRIFFFLSTQTIVHAVFTAAVEHANCYVCQSNSNNYRCTDINTIVCVHCT